MNDYDIIKQRAAETMPYKMAFMKAVMSGNKERISMYERQLMEKANALIDEFPDSLAAYVVYISHSTTIFQYYNQCGDVAQTARLALNIVKRCQWLDGKDNVQAMTMLLNAKMQLLLSLLDCEGKSDLAALVAKSCEELIAQLKLKDPQNQILQQAQLVVEHVKKSFSPANWNAINYNSQTYLDKISRYM